MSFCMELEDHLIPPAEWKDRYEEMPLECKKIVDDDEDIPIGIGYKEGKGWFVLASGQGPFVVWQEWND